MLALAGVPGIYVHSLIGSENWQEGVEQTGANRTINRRKLEYAAVEEEFDDESSLRSLVFRGYKALLEARGSDPAFNPKSPQRVVESDTRLFVLLRGPFLDQPEEDPEAGTESSVLCIHNLSGDLVEFRDRKDTYPWPEEGVIRELISGDLVYPSEEGSLFSLELHPHEVMWLQF